MSEIPLVWRKAGDPAPEGLAAYENHMQDTDLFYGAVHNEFLLGWAKREFGKGYIAMLSWRVSPDSGAAELGRTRTLAEAKELLEGYVYVWWLTAEAQEMKDQLRNDHEKFMRRMSQQQRTASEASARLRNMSAMRGSGGV